MPRAPVPPLGGTGALVDVLGLHPGHILVAEPYGALSAGGTASPAGAVPGFPFAFSTKVEAPFWTLSMWPAYLPPVFESTTSPALLMPSLMACSLPRIRP